MQWKKHWDRVGEIAEPSQTLRPRAQRWEGSRPRPAAAGSFPKPTIGPNQALSCIENADPLAARGDPTSPSETPSNHRATGYVGQAARPPDQ
jgi:hypothetical protein